MIRPSAPWVFTGLGIAVVAFAITHAWPRAADTGKAGPSASVSTGGTDRTTAELEAALSQTAAHTDFLERQQGVLEFIGRARPMELRRLFLSRTTTRREKQAIAQRWAEVDPSSLLEFLKGVSRTEWYQDSLYPTVRGILFYTWATREPEAAIAAAAAFDRRPAFRGAEADITLALFATDPRKAFELAATQGRRVEAPIPEGVWKANPVAFLQAAGEAKAEALERATLGEAVAGAFSDWAQTDPVAAAAWLKNRPSAQRHALWPKLAERLAALDPAAAQAWFASVPPSVDREAAGTAIVKAWASKDPQSALAWLQDSLQGGRTEAFTHVAQALADNGIDQARQLLDAMPSGAQRDEVVATIATSWMNKEPRSAMAWLLSLPADDPGRSRALDLVHSEWARQDLPAAAAFVAEHQGRGEARNMLWSVPAAFVAQDVPGGVAWAANLPEDVRDQAFGSLMRSAGYTGKLPEAFAALEALPSEQQQSLVGKWVEQEMSSPSFRAEDNSQLLRLLRTIPPALHDTARSAVEAATSASPERRAAAREVLKTAE